MAGDRQEPGGRRTQLWASALLFSCCLLGRLWVITPQLACRDVLTGHTFRPLPRSNLGWERKQTKRRVSRKGLLQGEKARTQGIMIRDGIPPKEGPPQLEKAHAAQRDRLSKARARCLQACESWAYFPAEQGLLCSCGWSLENKGRRDGERSPSGVSTESRWTADCTFPSTTPRPRGPTWPDRKETLTESQSP